MQNHDTPSSGRRAHPRRGLRLFAVGTAAAFILGLTASAAAALSPNPDTAWEPLYAADDSWWTPPAYVPEPATPEHPESPPAPPPAEPPAPEPSYETPGGGSGTEFDTGTQDDVPAPVADPSGPAPAPVDVPEATEAQGQISEEKATRQTEAALDEAERLMKRFDACKRLIGTSEPVVGPPVFPWDRLNEFRRDNRVADTFQMAGPAGTPARVLPLNRPDVPPVMQLFQEFHADPPDELLYKVFGDGQYRRTVDYMFETLGGRITAKEFRALVILHELAHVTRTLGEHGTPETAVVGWKFSSDIFTLCIRGDRTPTAPRRDGRGPYVGDEDVPQLPDVGTAPIGLPPCLPESELPEVRGPFEEVPDQPGNEPADPANPDEADPCLPESDLPEVSGPFDEVPSDPGHSEDPVLGDCCEEVPDTPESDLPDVTGPFDEVPGDPDGFGAPDPFDPCAPYGCMDPDPGEPFDPGFGGGETDPGYDDWGGGYDPWCCSGGGGGGGGGGDGEYRYGDEPFWIEEEFAA